MSLGLRIHGMKRRPHPRRAEQKKKRALLAAGAVLAAVLLFFAVRAFPLAPHAPEDTPAPTRAAATPAPTPPPTLSPPALPTRAPDGLSASGSTVTVAWLSDTQHYPKIAPEIFASMTRFLYEEQSRLNLRYIVHTGDFVDDRGSPAQWENAMTPMANLEGIPYGVLAGNHDVGRELDFGVYGELLGEDAMRARPGSEAYYGGSYQNNRGHYDLLELGADPFLFVYMSYGPDNDAIRWINGVFKAYPERIGVLCVHDYFKTDLTYSDAGAALLKKVVKKNPNLYLVLCGHRYTVGHVALELDDDGDGKTDRTVYQMIQNYQGAGSTGGGGYLQFLQFDGENRELRVLSYSPYLDDRRYHDTPGAELEKYPVDPKDEEYVIPYPWG